MVIQSTVISCLLHTNNTRNNDECRNHVSYSSNTRCQAKLLIPNVITQTKIKLK
uniref:Uncharacterized protein n=1 Tax=Arundo donax TaxID=35708 RepID=A0A0A8Y018_ARUDO